MKSNILANFNKYVKKLEKAAQKSCEDFEKSVRQDIIDGTPKDTGKLRESYSFGRTNTDGYVVEYTFSFGGGLVNDKGQPYAGEVHEWYNPEVNWTTEGTGPGYLRKPVAAYANDLKTIYSLNARRITL